ncbi:cytochrome c biogenesis protein ResB [Speluncibacter jeojiensis]|uniref:Cytochrome c biogenesis protein ResB n=1 Tax=Speluncibacter jeojiensis TaxID=2710754 RepID=A0A9X4M130_9ACTN|nr:cytochrome c biogenesis protein ResB [Corynebacteriales bacterium D3-21]
MTTTQQRPSPPEEPRVVKRQSTARRALALVRNAWRGLTSMKTALILLFLLALAAIPGALIPQRSLNAQKVDRYIADHTTIGPWMDKLELFDVFGSFWFTAVYVLLFISLVGCILPRVVEHAKALRSAPVAAPRNLGRLPHHSEQIFDGSVDENVQRVRGVLRGWRVTTRQGTGERSDEVTVSAERGYLREAGNILFHLSLVGLLLAIGLGKMFSYEGNVIVVADPNGAGFCNTTPAVYDSFRAGATENGTGLKPFCVKVKDFNADYLPTGEAKMFRAHIDYQATSDLASDTWHQYDLRVNDPLRIDGDRVYLQGHGFAPTFTVTFPDGTSRTQTLQFRPDDARFFLSSGAMRFDPPGGMYPNADERRKHQIAIEGLFAPTAMFEGNLMQSVAPTMQNPAVAIDIYKGDTGLDTGRAQSIFSLDPSMISQGRLVKQTRVNLKEGQSATLTDGTKVTFDGAKEFVNLQVSHDPTQDWVLVFAVTMIAGLLVSLLVKRRRVWARIYPDAASASLSTGKRRTVVELGGLARTDQAGWGEEFTKLGKRLSVGEQE